MNILVGSDADSSKVCLGDFGVAATLEDAQEEFWGNKAKKSPSGGFHKGKVVGSIEYLAPELLMMKSPPHFLLMYMLCLYP